MNADTTTFSYTLASDFEVIRATKSQLQSFGIGAGLAFPGEGRAPRQVFTCDPRGYRARIERGEGGHFSAHIFYPGRVFSWPHCQSPQIEGLQSATDNGPYADCYTGGGAEIVAAGLARMDQMPGHGGGAKVQVCILPDGSIASGSDPRRNEAGATRITRRGKSAYSVVIQTTAAEQQRRQRAVAEARMRWELEKWNLPAPALLLAVHREIKRLAAAEQEAHAPANLHNGFWLRTAGEA